MGRCFRGGLRMMRWMGLGCFIVGMGKCIVGSGIGINSYDGETSALGSVSV